LIHEHVAKVYQTKPDEGESIGKAFAIKSKGSYTLLDLVAGERFVTIVTTFPAAGGAGENKCKRGQTDD